jgi:hypothetical protein
MAEEKKERQPAAQNEQKSNMYEDSVSPVRDAALTVTQPTSYKLSAGQMALGGVPDNRFTEEVVKGSDEDSGSGWETHPEENQPIKGIAEGDELPDTTGRAALRDQKK